MALANPIFIERDPVKVVNEMIADYESKTGKTLQPGQVESIIFQVIGYRESLIREAIQEAGKQNLLAFAKAPMIDYLGQLLGVSRLPAVEAITVLQFSLVEGHTGVTIPAGTRVASVDGKAVFETDESKVINSGILSVNIGATCQTAGTVGNGYAIGRVNVLLDPYAYIDTVANTSITDGGSNEETDDELRERIYDAPNQFSNAGSRGAYRYWAKTANPAIIDVGVNSTVPGTVNIYPLVAGGVASQTILDQVAQILNADEIRPLSDTVVVANPTLIEYDISVNIVLYSETDEVQAQAAIEANLNAFKLAHEQKIGLDIIKQQIANKCIIGDSVYNVSVTSPANDIVVNANEFARCNSITVNIIGTNNG